MMNSFDIQDSDTTGTLILICKTYLKMNQAIDCGDMEGYGKLSRVYDSLRKSAKFTAAQKKEQKEKKGIVKMNRLIFDMADTRATFLLNHCLAITKTR